MRYINELHEGENVSEIYLCKSKQTLKTRSGKSYDSLLLQDRTGNVDAKIWDLNNGIESFEALDYIHVEAQVVLFQNSFQLNIHRLRKAKENEYNVMDYVPTTKKDRKEMWHQIKALIASVENPYCKKLLEQVFIADTEFAKAFITRSAARSIHHGFLGGLLEHTLSVAQNADYMAGHYPVLNRDLLVTCALLHDIGKVKELSAFPENEYTDVGNLLGHIYMGTEMVQQKIDQIPDFPPALAGQIKHCILAHHGELEYGSPKKPALVEAIALNLADNIDAKMQTFQELLEDAAGKPDWLGYNKLFESNLRKTTM